MLERYSLKTRLVASACAVGGLMVAMVAIGYASLEFGVRATREVADRRLPAIQGLWQMKEALVEGLKNERTMMIATTTPKAIEFQKARLVEAWARAEEGRRIYEPHVDTAEKRAIWDNVTDLYGKYRKAQEGVMAALGGGSDEEKECACEAALEASEYYTPMRDALFSLIAVETRQAEGVRARFHARSRTFLLFLLAAGAAGIVLSVAAGVLTALSVSRALDRAVGTIADGAERVSSAAGEMASSALSLSSGASEQAASLQRTSDAMERLSAMTARNAGDAEAANGLARRMRGEVDRAKEAMEALVGSMEEISRMGEETGKIVRGIDEIASQTNLLALNAAVEAARAGEAGAGFAVVADEVRTLSRRAAEAARGTSGLIEGTVGRIREGTSRVLGVDAAFREAAASMERIAGLLAGISGASAEQSKGIEEVGRVVRGMGRVTQDAAAQSEEIAAASQELSGQSDALRSVVDGLREIVEGRKEGTG